MHVFIILNWDNTIKFEAVHSICWLQVVSLLLSTKKKLWVYFKDTFW